MLFAFLAVFYSVIGRFVLLFRGAVLVYLVFTQLCQGQRTTVRGYDSNVSFSALFFSVCDRFFGTLGFRVVCHRVSVGRLRGCVWGGFALFFLVYVRGLPYTSFFYYQV